VNKHRLWILLFAIPFVVAISLSAGVAHVQRPSSQNADPSCSTSTPCLEWQNTGSGLAIEGVAKQKAGLLGETLFNSTSASNFANGIVGQDASTSGAFDSGVLGKSVRGTGVTGSSTSGIGVRAISQSANALYATSVNQPSILASTTSNDGANISTTNNSSCIFCRGRSGIYAHDDSTDGGRLNVGVEGASINGIGVQGNSTNWVGVNAVGGYPSTVSYPALSVVGNPGSLITGYPELIAACATGTANPCSDADAVFELQQSGDVSIKGIITTAGSCSKGCSPTSMSQAKRVRFFTPRESLPTVEDFGEGELINGQAYVRLDPAFANTMDPGTSYMAFITPEGNSRGVYVTAKTPAGFVVRENQSGRSTLAFSYRIVAKPYGEHPVRFQMITMALPRTRSRGSNR
jgi:hypothetical protein